MINPNFNTRVSIQRSREHDTADTDKKNMRSLSGNDQNHNATSHIFICLFIYF